MIDPIALSVPGFFVAIGIEALVAKRRRVSVYRFADSITDLSCGVASQIEAVFFIAIQLGIYAWVYEDARLLTLTGWPLWVVAFFGVDFLYYWWHRLSHEMNFLWAAHVVHHQSEDYNLAVALRQSITTGWSALPFYLPLALVGVPVTAFALVHALSTLYQFWIHTQLVGKIKGPLDWVLNLPHHHRVHHAINPQYLDKNYGATLIVWDRLFGTYIEEEEPCVYGITKPLASFNPLWAQVHYWIELVRKTFTLRGLDRLRVWVGSPAWKPKDAPPLPPVDLAHREKYDVDPSVGTRRWVRSQYIVLLVATSVVLMAKASMPRAALVLACVWIGAGLVSLGGLLEAKKWALPLEVARFAALVAGMFVLRAAWT
jgi:alkylglycerol monooxygenase